LWDRSFIPTKFFRNPDHPDPIFTKEGARGRTPWLALISIKIGRLRRKPRGKVFMMPRLVPHALRTYLKSTWPPFNESRTRPVGKRESRSCQNLKMTRSDPASIA